MKFLTKALHLFLALSLILASCRGLIVLSTEVNANLVYRSTTVFMLFLSVCGLCLSLSKKHASEVETLKILCFTNLFFGVVWTLLSFLFGTQVPIEWIFIYIAPFSCFVFMALPERFLRFSIYVIILIVGASVISNFLMALDGESGLSKLIEYRTKLRPETFVGLSRTGNFYRAAGLTGDAHDSANLLGMLLMFCFFRGIEKQSPLDFGAIALATPAVLLTQSASNIIVMLFTICVLGVLYFSHYFSVQKMLRMLVVMGGIALSLILIFDSYLLIFTKRLGSSGDWKGIFRHLDFDSLFLALPHLVFGFAYSVNHWILSVESAFLKIIFNQGLVPALVFFTLLVYPLFKAKVYSYHKSAAILFGFLSLVHYGSVLRSTGVFIFFAIYASFFQSTTRNRWNASLALKQAVV